MSGGTTATAGRGSGGQTTAGRGTGGVSSASGGATGAAGGRGGASGQGAQAGGMAADAAGLAKFSFFVTSLVAMRSLSKNQNGFGGDLRLESRQPHRRLGRRLRRYLLLRADSVSARGPRSKVRGPQAARGLLSERHCS